MTFTHFCICISIRWYIHMRQSAVFWKKTSSSYELNPWCNIYSQCIDDETETTPNTQKNTRWLFDGVSLVGSFFLLFFFTLSLLSMACLARVSTFSVWFVISYAQRFATLYTWFFCCCLSTDMKVFHVIPCTKSDTPTHTHGFIAI